MKTIAILLILIMLFPSFTFAGEIYGSIKVMGNSIGPGKKVEIISADNTPYVKETDKYGSYSIYVKETGRCTLKVHYRGKLPEIIVYSYKRAVRYNLLLESEGENYFLRRK